MTKADSNALVSKLKSSLPKPTTAKTEPAAVRPTVPPEASPRAQSSRPVVKTAGGGEGEGLRAPKISVSLYQTDLGRLDEIKEFMRGKGHRNLSDSEALRLACRAVQISDDFLDFYRHMQREDGRRRVTAKP